MLDAAAQSWTQIASQLALRTQAFIGGRQVDAADGRTFETINPATGAVLARVASCDAADVDRAVEAARRAFESGVWSRLAPLIDAHKDELACLESLDVGKPISDCLAVDLPLTSTCIRWYGEAIDKIYDEIAPTAPSAISLMRREPIGVIAAVVPWNFPLLMAAWKIGPVLAAGNSIIVKPAVEFSSLEDVLVVLTPPAAATGEEGS